MTISLNATDANGDDYDDRSIYACSRQGKVNSSEKCTITFLDANAYSLYSEKLGASDWKMKILMMSVTSKVTSSSKYYTVVKDY